MIALIGPNWLARDAEGKRKIDDEEDWVRMELLAGFDRKIPIIPVVLNRAPIPKSADLPAQLVRLSRIQAMPFESERFRGDADGLTRVVRSYLPEVAPLQEEVRRQISGWPVPVAPNEPSKIAVANTKGTFGNQNDRQFRRWALVLFVTIATAILGVWGLLVLYSPPEIDDSHRLSNVEKAITSKDLKAIQRTLCVAETGDPGPAGSETRVALQEFMSAQLYPADGNATGVVKTNTDLGRLADALEKIPSCQKAGLMNAFEVGIFTRFGAERVRREIAGALGFANRPAPPALTYLSLPVDSSFRSAIGELRSVYGLPAGAALNRALYDRIAQSLMR
jgi:hypothetical protein